MLERQEIIDKAREKYIATGHTKNITEALRLYLENDAGTDEQIPLFISNSGIKKLRDILKEIRPQCDECGSRCHLQINARDPQGKQYPTSWICKNCSLEYFSDKTPAEWYTELQDEARKQKLHGTHEPDQPDLPNMRQATKI